jgi:hypothetical protein
MRTCACCGDSISRKNAYGYCSRTPECRSRYHQAYQDARRAPDTPPAQPCKSCGIPTTARSGYCKRTATCDAARKRAEYKPDEYKPDDDRRHCVTCGKRLYRNTPVPTALCPACDGTRRAQRRRMLKAETMLAYGGACACCGEENVDFLTIDHIDGNGAAERTRFRDPVVQGRGRGGANFYYKLKADGFPDPRKYQVLCANCNGAKGTGRECPCRKSRLSVYEVVRPGQLALF